MRFSFDKIKEVPKTSTLTLATMISFIPFFFLSLFYAFNERTLKAAYGFGILDFELAWTPSMVHRIFAAWGPAGMRYLAFDHYVDDAYLVCYGLFGALAILLIARKLKGRPQEIGFFFVLTPILAAVFDALENTFLLSMLNRGADLTPQDPFLASLCAIIKIPLLGATVSFLFVAVLLLLVQRYKIPYVYYYIVLAVTGGIVMWLLSLWNYYLCFEMGLASYAVALLVVWSLRSDRQREAAA